MYDSLDELRNELGQPLTHGLYDPALNCIHATKETLAHEIAHYRDLQSGRMPRPAQIENLNERRRARLRNEIVAILFSWIKTREIKHLAEHERRFLEWLYFLIDRGVATPQEPLETMSFEEMQNFATDLVDYSDQENAALDTIFRHYIPEEERRAFNPVIRRA